MKKFGEQTKMHLLAVVVVVVAVVYSIVLYTVIVIIAVIIPPAKNPTLNHRTSMNSIFITYTYA